MHIALGLCICMSVTLFDALHITWTVHARVLKFQIWIPYVKIADPYFFYCPSYLPFWSDVPLKKSEWNLVSNIHVSRKVFKQGSWNLVSWQELMSRLPDYFLAHLSWRLTMWAYSIQMVRPSSSSTHSNLNISEASLASLDQILFVASLETGKDCIRFWGGLDQNSGFHGNRKSPLIYNGENYVSTFSQLFLIQSFFILAGNKDMHKISDEFKFPRDRTTYYGVSCPWAS